MTALAAAATLLGSPTHAQGGPPPGYGGPPQPGWQFDHYDEAVSGQSSGPAPVFPPTVYTPTAGAGWYGSSITNTLTPYFVWNGPGTAPPLSAWLKGNATATPPPGPPSSADTGGSASDGLGDAQQQLPGGQPGVLSQGIHLLPVPGSQGVSMGTVVRGPKVTLSAGASAVDALGVNLTAGPDSRIVTISTSLGQTYYKGAALTDNGSPQPAPNVRGTDGTLTDDSVVSTGGGDNIIVTYYPNVSGSWTPQSSYLWHLNYGASLGSNSGTFWLPNIPPAYYGGQFGSSVQGEAHCYIDLTDANNGAHATANHYIRWHQPVENWLKNGYDFEIAPTAFYSSLPPQSAGGQDNVSVQAPGQVNISSGEHLVGGFLAGAGPIIALPFFETDPILLSLAAVGSYTFSLASPPAATLYTVNGTLDKFTTSVGEQLSIASGNTSGVFQPTINRMDTGFAKAVAAWGVYADYFTPNTQNQNAPQGSLTFNAAVYLRNYQQNYLGDGYGENGYTGSVPGYIQWPDGTAYIYSWKWAGSVGTPTVGTPGTGGSTNG